MWTFEMERKIGGKIGRREVSMGWKMLLWVGRWAEGGLNGQKC